MSTTIDAPAARASDSTSPSAVDVFLAVVAERGGALAVTSPGARLTYAELAERSAACALSLALPRAEQDEAAPGEVAPPVALLAESSAALVAAAMGVLMAGRSLVVLDPQLPPARLQQILDIAGARTLLVDDELAEVAGSLTGVGAPLSLPALMAPEPSGAATTALERWQRQRPVVEASSIATTIFTSGSTGVPKGVLCSHALIVSEAPLTQLVAGTAAGTRLGLIVPPAFAVGQLAIFAGLLTGASLHAFDPRERGSRGLADWLDEEGVEVVHATPSLLRALVSTLPQDAPAGSALPRLRQVVCAGEPLQGRDVLAARARIADLTVVNSFGSPETWSTTWFRIGPDDPAPEGVVPAGYPIPGKLLEVVDPDSGPLAEGLAGGELGVLQVSAPVLASGYVGDAAVVAGGPGPFATTATGWTSYRMGDLARFEPDGLVRLAGRADDAIKVRGYLVEPAEVEGALRAQPGVGDAAVMAVRGEAATLLVAYVVPDGRARTPSPAQLRRGLRAVLPDWMVPAELVMMAQLPRTERGKVDRAALPRPTSAPGAPPQGRWELVVADLWCAVLSRTDVGRDQSFTALGGDSLAAEEFLARLDTEHGVALTSADVAEAPTVAELARVVAAAAAAGEGRRGRRRTRRGHHDSLVVLRATGSGLPLFCFAGAGATAQGFSPLAAALPEDRPVLAFQPVGLEDGAFPDLTVGAAARRHLRRLREVQPHGPYLLAGHSLGGLIALSVARRLTAMGEQVLPLTLLDTVLPGAPAWSEDDTATAPDGAATRPGARLRADRRRALAALVLRRRGREQMDNLRELGVRLSQLHRPRRWDGSAVLYRSHLTPQDERAWAQVVAGSLRIVTLAADHNSLLRAPSVERIAEGVELAALRAEA